MSNLPPLRPPPRRHSPGAHRSESALSQTSMRSESSLSNASTESAGTSQMLPPPPPVARRGPYIQHTAPTRPSTAGESASQSTTSIQSVHRQPSRTSVDGLYRTTSPPTQPQQTGHRARQHSQGMFDTSLSSQAASNPGLSASQIAAQAAMHGVSPPPPTERKRSNPHVAPINTGAGNPIMSRRVAGDVQSPPLTAGLPYSNGIVGGHRLAAATAASAAYPSSRSPLPSPGMPSQPPQQQTPPPLPLTQTQSVPQNYFQAATPPPAEKESRSKTSKMKIFSKAPKTLNLAKEGKSSQGMSSPSKNSISSNLLRGGFANSSTTSLVDPGSSASSIYSSANASTSTLVPTSTEKDREKRHHFLSRQKNKKEDPSHLPLSSAHSNSQPTNPDKPQPLYSFTPDSPGPTGFSKSMSGFDLRHGGRALREKKKEEKAAAAAARYDLTTVPTNSSASGQADQFLGPSQFDNGLGPPSGGTASLFSFPSDTAPAVSAQAFSNIGAQMGLPGIGPDDAWPLLKARLLNLFSGEDLRTPIEDFNTLVNVHIRRCIQRKSAVVLLEDVRELLQTGFVSLAQTLRGIPDDRVVPKFVEIWTDVYCNMLPFLQAVFLPLDLEFKGRGVIMSVREAQEFWGALPESLKLDERPTSAGGSTRTPTLGEELDIRRITLICFRDTVILPKHETLMAIFSRLSLDSINAGTSSTAGTTGREHARSDPSTTGAERPGTAGSLSPHLASFNSQTSTLMDAASTSSGGSFALAGRSRATSSTSAGSFGTSLPYLNSPTIGGPGSFNPMTSHPQSPPTGGATTPQPAALTDPAKVTDTVARMLQCLYVLASCQTGDVGQGVVERLTGALKYNWLGRGRTGRNRRGWVGMKNPPGQNQRIGLVGA